MIDPTDRPVYGAIHAPSAEPVETPPRRRGVLPWLVAAVAFAFALGLLTNPWFDRNIRGRLLGVETPPAAGPPAREVTALRARLAALEARADESAPAAVAPMTSATSADPAIEARLINLETELAELRQRADSSIATAAEGAERAQTALLVAALRRAVDSGRRFDAYEPALRARFGTSHPNEVAALLAFTQQPVTTEQLSEALIRLAPAVDRAEAEGRGWWSSLKAGVAGIVAVRRAGTSTTDPQVQLRTAAARVEAGDVEGALRLIATLPTGARQALASWTAEAHRSVAVSQALAALEVAALTPVPATVTAPPAPTNL